MVSLRCIPQTEEVERITSLSLSELRKAIAAGELKPSQVLLAYQAKVRRRSPRPRLFSVHGAWSSALALISVPGSSSHDELYRRIHRGGRGGFTYVIV